MASHSCVLSRMETAEYAPREVMASVQPQCIVDRRLHGSDSETMPTCLY